MEIQFIKCRDVLTPTRAHEFDAGWDLYIPNDFSSRTLNKGYSILIPSGIKLSIPQNYVGIINNRSSVASKLGIIVGASIIDSGYVGEIHLDLHKVTENYAPPLVLHPGQKIAQIIFFPIPNINLIEVPLFKASNSIRGENGFGSSDRKDN